MKRKVLTIFGRRFFFYLVTLNLVTSQSVSKRCGISGTATGFIFHGELSERGQYPWTVSLHLVKNDAFVCGGTLLSSKLVSTAAHCIHNKGRKHRTTPEELVVKLGKYDLAQRFERGSVTTHIDEIYVHPNWKNYTQSFDSDIAIISLETPVQYSYLIFPICLWDHNVEPSTKKGTVVGWGKSERGGVQETKLREVEINIKTNEECFLSNPRLADLSSSSTFCAGNPQEAKSVCFGDSGSGLLVRDKDIWYLKGIVSSSLFEGKNCDVNNYAIFTNVPKMMDWIKEIFKKSESSMLTGLSKMFYSKPAPETSAKCSVGSTLGGIGVGGLSGALAGAAAGSVVPLLGTVAGAAVGFVLGTAAGGAGGAIVSQYAC